MSKPHRCKSCGHRPGLRSTSPMALAEKGKHEAQAKKAPCRCECHE